MAHKGVSALALLGALLALALAPAATVGDTAGPSLSIDGDAGRQAISPDIYGMNFADPATAAEIALPVDRWGGNETETYNWQNGAENTGSDWYFENVDACVFYLDRDCTGWANGDRYDLHLINQDRSVGAQTLYTLPLMGSVASDGATAPPFTCAFPFSTFPGQPYTDADDPGCGGGVDQNGNDLTPNPSLDSISGDAGAWDSTLVSDLVSRYGTAAHGGVAFYELGNEPGLWNATHRDMHPTATTYDELWQKSQEVAAAVKTVDPGAQIIGPSEWGWPNYFCSAADGAPAQSCDETVGASLPDRAAHGGTPLTEWYLQQFAAYQRQHGTRLLDYLDLHYYDNGGTTADITRSLWDPSYTNPASWIDEPIDLIPRMKTWVAADYPGTKTSLSEYNLSIDGTTQSGAVLNALIQADTLGIFAREGLDMATRWNLDNPAFPHYDGPYIDDAFQMYRNYDGDHSQFGDTYVQSTSSDQSQLAVYGAQRSSDGAYTVMVINKTGQSLTSTLSLSLSSIVVSGATQAWQWDGGSIAQIASPVVSGSSITETYPASSITLLVLPTVTSAGATGPTGDTAVTGLTGPTSVPGVTGATGATDPGSGEHGSVATSARCVVPRLLRHTLEGVEAALSAAHCRLGKIAKPSRVGRRAVLRVAGQSPAKGTRLPSGARVSIRLVTASR